ncbi:unnamed protein product [Nippostrongylus brasiliensis]|uniref:DUF982 domain-containing protein n=1 Tax=Nippostrongylus brasiliensis TaxID=27835 RepID=A0A0N4YI52_NIPBR|nr:hypothetical protein Q1695_007145 [Nippostrongylus brasiliensis]VDL80167.1 unnamed protein product [Nippostrongylus brasiliensis]
MELPTSSDTVEESTLSHLHLTYRWAIEEAPPFKQTDLNALMACWRMPARAGKHDHITHCVDFARFFFARATDPVEEITKYTVRISGKHAKDATKIDLPPE